MNVGEDLFEVGLPTLLGSATDTHSLQKITTCFFNNKQKQENYIKIMKDLLLNYENKYGEKIALLELVEGILKNSKENSSKLEFEGLRRKLSEILGVYYNRMMAENAVNVDYGTFIQQLLMMKGFGSRGLLHLPTSQLLQQQLQLLQPSFNNPSFRTIHLNKKKFRKVVNQKNQNIQQNFLKMDVNEQTNQIGKSTSISTTSRGGLYDSFIHSPPQQSILVNNNTSEGIGVQMTTKLDETTTDKIPKFDFRRILNLVNQKFQKLGTTQNDDNNNNNLEGIDAPKNLEK